MPASGQGSNGQPVRNGTLSALTAAALSLPGLTAPAIASAQDNSVLVQFGHYRESGRELYGPTSKLQPIESDSLQASAWFDVTDRLKGLINFRQDTWSGATPIATAPREWRGNRSRAPDGVSGASPYLIPAGLLFLDRKTLLPIRTDGFGNITGGVDPQLVHTLTGASPEVRRQGDFNLRREWDESTLDVGGGVSSEPDYLSRFIGAAGRWDFNQKLTTVNLGVNYTASSVSAILDHDATPYIYNACGTPSCNFFSSTGHIDNMPGGKKVLSGDRHDWIATIGLTQVINPNAQVNTNLAYTRSQGYLSNPYRVVEVAFIDPELQFLAPSPDVLYANVQAILERRPDLRNQWLWNVRYAQYIDATDAGLHLNYAYFRDDWSIRAHTFEAEWAQPFGDDLMVTPMVRYYTQSAAYFYTPYLVTNQGQRTTTADPSTGKVVVVPFDMALLPPYYSSDYRLSAYGALIGGVTITKQFAKGVTLSVGAQYMQHAGKLKLGGGGEGSYADFNSYLVNASLTFAMDAAARTKSTTNGHDHGTHDMHAGHADGSAFIPAGVMFGHVLPGAGDLMASLRYVNGRTADKMLHGSKRVDDSQVKADGCNGILCLAAPTGMTTNMYMLELMYAPTDWLTLMVMPQYMDMTMGMRGLLGEREAGALPPDLQALYQHHTMHDHTSGGIGDTGLYASFRLLEGSGHELHATLGITVPTGDVDVRFRDTHQLEVGRQDYGMQLGSGTWDFNPSITYTGIADRWFWGAQLSAVTRLESANSSGYALGDVVQGSLWGGYRLQDSVSASVRGIYTSQRAIKGRMSDPFRPLSPVDYPSNYGGRYWDLGIGINYSLGGAWSRNQVGIEWVQPLQDDVNGYQLERRGTLNATWQYHF